MNTYRIERTTDQKEWVVHDGAGMLSEEDVKAVASGMFTKLVEAWLKKNALPKGVGMRIICNDNDRVTDEVSLFDIDVSAAHHVIKNIEKELRNDITTYIRSVYVNTYRALHCDGDVTKKDAREIEKIIREEEKCLTRPLMSSMFHLNNASL